MEQKLQMEGELTRAQAQEILGVREDTPESEITSTYRKLAKENHPDLNLGSRLKEEKFKYISKAYAILTNTLVHYATKEEVASWREGMFENTPKASMLQAAARELTLRKLKERLKEIREEKQEE